MECSPLEASSDTTRMRVIQDIIVIGRKKLIILNVELKLIASKLDADAWIPQMNSK